MPVLIRTGKRLPMTVTEAVVEFHAPPRPLFADADCLPHPNHIRYSVKPDDTISMSMQAKLPGSRLVSRAVDLSIPYAEQLGGEGPTAYERLIGDASDGDARLFARRDAVDAAWRVVDPALSAAAPVETYEPGTWGPGTAERVLPTDEGWHPCAGETSGQE